MEDAYTYYVLLLGISEELFWNADISFIKGVVDDKAAFDGWENYVRRKERERAERSSKSKARRRHRR